MGLCQHGLGDTKRAAASLQVAARLLDKIQDRAERTAWTATIQQAMGALRVPRDVKPVADQRGEATTHSRPRDCKNHAVFFLIFLFFKLYLHF